VPEGRPYILSGAREALDQGAPHEVELALRTGMDLLEEKERPRATLLLAEAVGEDGRWEEALAVLAEGLPQVSGDQRAEYDALHLHYKLRTSITNIPTIVDILRQAGDIVSTARTTDARLQAAAAGALACSELRDKETTLAFRSRLEPMLALDLDARARSSLLLSVATLSAHCDDNNRALQLVQEASRLAASHGLMSSLRARIENGLGAALVAIGHYQEAIPHLAESVRLLQALGNDVMLRVSLNNLALCHFRLGQYELQLATARTALQLPTAERPSLDTLFTHHHAAVACGFLGLGDEAQRNIEEAMSAFGRSELGWVRQRTLMMAADVSWLAGNRRRALAYATSLVEEHPARPLAQQITGGFCRWAGILASGPRPLQGAQLEVERAAARRSSLDLVDRLEVLGSLSLLRPLSPEEQGDLQACLEALPPSTAEQLRQFGLKL
jgi:tetratricopeptide (TPR) repeat protein